MIQLIPHVAFIESLNTHTCYVKSVVFLLAKAQFIAARIELKLNVSVIGFEIFKGLGPLKLRTKILMILSRY